MSEDPFEEWEMRTGGTKSETAAKCPCTAVATFKTALGFDYYIRCAEEHGHAPGAHNWASRPDWVALRPHQVKTYDADELLEVYLAKRQKLGKPEPRAVPGRYDRLTADDSAWLRSSGIQP